jgi:DNA-binding PadR family transcriptional regulator
MTEQRKLLILGLLYKTDMHGYMLNAHLGMNIPITLKKPTAYNILDNLEKEKLVKSTEESTGERRRKVFSLTPAGEEEYKRLLKLQLATFIPGEFPNVVSLGFLDDISNNEAIFLLHERLCKLEEYGKSFDLPNMEGDENHAGSAFLSFEFVKQALNLEKKFIEKVIRKLEK